MTTKIANIQGTKRNQKHTGTTHSPRQNHSPATELRQIQLKKRRRRGEKRKPPAEEKKRKGRGRGF